MLKTIHRPLNASQKYRFPRPLIMQLMIFVIWNLLAGPSARESVAHMIFLDICFHWRKAIIDALLIGLVCSCMEGSNVEMEAYVVAMTTFM